jgi:hypothetical protein
MNAHDFKKQTGHNDIGYTLRHRRVERLKSGTHSRLQESSVKCVVGDAELNANLTQYILKQTH